MLLHFLVLCIVLPLSGNAMSADGELAFLYAPNAGQGSAYIPLEVVVPGTAGSPEGLALTEALKNKMEQVFHPAGADDDVSAKCFVAVHQLEATDIPVFRMECWSPAQSGGGQPYVELTEAVSPEQVLVFTRAFAKKHFERVRQAKPLQHPPISVRVT